MPEEEPNEQSAGAQRSDDASQARKRRSRPRMLTPEQRRFLGKPRPLHKRIEPERKIEEEVTHEEPTPPVPPRRIVSEPPRPRVEEVRAEKMQVPEPTPVEETSEKRASVIRPDAKSSRRIEMQHATLIIGAILLLCFTFYVGKKFDYWRYLLMTKMKEPKLMDKVPAKFANTSAQELIEQALRDERANDWRSAIERFIAAKHKNLAYRGVLFHVGRLAYENGDFDNADKLFERAIAFHENIDTANYFRGLIATRRRDLPAAERFFEAAATADPFTADYHYYWAEALRLDHHPQEAIPRYEQAERRAHSDQDQTVCRFKVRIARLEAGQGAQLKNEIEEKGNAGPLPLDWLLAKVAVAVREGRMPDAGRMLNDARALSRNSTNGDGIFFSCTGDRLFQDVCKQHIELADICRVKSAAK